MHAAKMFRHGVLALVPALALATSAQAGPVTLPGGSKIEKVDFERHIMGLLGKLGCNSGACHGSFQGRGGLYLSLFGYSPEKDYNAFTKDEKGRRVQTANPERSLMLLKGSGQVPHGGGQRFEEDSWQYQLIREWIVQGAKWEKGSGAVKSIDVTPREHQLVKPGDSVQLKVTAEFADGSKEDITPFCEYRVNDDYLAEVAPSGVVKSIRPGDTAVVSSYRGNILAARVLIPVPAEKGFAYPKVPESNYIDREVFAKLKKLNVVPSELSGDGEFLRRLYIDTIGCLPSPEEARVFMADKDPQKRAKKIDELLKHPLHAALWATKISDITGNNNDLLVQNANQQRDLAVKRSKMWHDWLRKRIQDNVAWDEIVKGILTATSRDGKTPEEWVDEMIKLDEETKKGFDTSYASRGSLDLFWARTGLTPELRAEHTAAAFMGVRIECAQCHKHPFDRWTQVDYRSYANVFAQLKVGISPAVRPLQDKLPKPANANNNQRNPFIREVYIDAGTLQRLPPPEGGGTLPAKALGGPEIDLSKDDARVKLYEWMRQSDNYYFARAFVNRVWAHYFGIGLVEPVDNFSVANPPSNALLLDALAKDFIDSKFDIRKLERTVLTSRTYQLTAAPTASNSHDRNNFSRAFPRRLMAEVVIDVMNSALDTTDNFGAEVPSGSKAIEVAPSRLQNANVMYLFRIFGRPPRTQSCDCERASEPALPQTLYLMTDQSLMGKITSGRLRKTLADKKEDKEVVDELFLATLTRLPSEQEIAWATEYVKKKGDRTTGFADVLWALVNTREFILNH